MLSYLSHLYQFLYQIVFGWSAPDPPLYIFPDASKLDLEYADLAIVDLSKIETESGRAELTEQVRRAMREVGFFYVVNHGYTAEQTRRIFSLANMTFDGVSDADKKRLQSPAPDVYQGYKPRQTWIIKDGVKDQIEHYNINKQVRNQEHPPALQPYIKELEHFTEHNHLKIVHPILRLLARGIGLPEEALVKQHQWKAPGESSARFMKYYNRSQEEEAKTKSVWLKGHHDIGCITILWSQPVGGLQILSPDGKWRWVKHLDNALVVNAGDGIDFLCGGYYSPTRHRVIQPPADQVGIDRVGVFYFSYADDDVELRPHTESPVLQDVGIKELVEPGKPYPTMKEWRKARVSSYGAKELAEGKRKGVEEEVVCGVVVPHYN
ncbi:Clavaminate synthase-like protein [Cylindrobasidium torrendii FP15055 ss-10]|uniref:Clavaminate synthase-like protein n=1 Tax=Cylindrobasidium torrendii FP15055 ss-10 TaxID=1314674 RepID=A0A0D7BTP9_9AGAR|nr:Clavaminate synthase-like protein [Cylindrobasidium torrendii FP15055 ss-10]